MQFYVTSRKSDFAASLGIICVGPVQIGEHLRTSLLPNKELSSAVEVDSFDWLVGVPDIACGRFVQFKLLVLEVTVRTITHL